MNHSINFVLEKRKDKKKELIVENVPLLADIKFASKRLYFYTGYRIDAKNFNPNMEMLKRNSFGKKGALKVTSKQVNDDLIKIRSALLTIFEGSEVPSKPEITNKLNFVVGKKTKGQNVDANTLVSWWEKYLTDGKQSDVRKRNIRSILNHWKAFEDKRKKTIYLEDFNLELLQRFDNFLQNERELSRNTVNKAMVITRAFLNFVRDLKPETPYPFGKDIGKYRIEKAVYGEPFYITVDERNHLENYPLRTKRLERVRDVFLFQSFVGCRYGDLSKLRRSNIVYGSLHYIAGKTKKGSPRTITVPLGNKALAILEKYADLPGGLILPPYAEPVINRYLKELFKLCGLNRYVSRLNPKTREPEMVQICELVSTHMARRTFVGALFSKNYDRDVIGSMSGHSRNSAALARYYTVEEEHKKRAINDIE